MISDKSLIEVSSAGPGEWKKFDEYAVDVDRDQGDKSREITLCSFERPHMRAFHCSWWGFFAAFFMWFSINPLLADIRDDLSLSTQEVWTSSIVGVTGTIIMRLVLGPVCDKYGARTPFAVVLCVAAIPTALTGLINGTRSLYIIRFCISIAGGTFVTCQYWTSRMFTKEVVGTANALAGGWGNLGAGVTQLIIGSMLFPLFRLIGGSPEIAWRTVCVVPAIMAFVTGIVIYRISDDTPKGNHTELKRHGCMRTDTSLPFCFLRGAVNMNTWILFLQYACCFGVELTMNNAAALYFKDEFGQSTEASAAIASIFGWLNLFARGLGGFVSDYSNSVHGMRGRLWTQTVFLLGEACLVLLFATTQTLAGAIIVLVFFSLFVQAAEGSSFGIIPYIDPSNTGTISGIVGAGGNVGAVCFGLVFRQVEYRTAFFTMGVSILGSSILSLFIQIKGHAAMLKGRDLLVDKETGSVIEPNTSYSSSRGGSN